MGLEIERKFLVNQDKLPDITNTRTKIKQGYLGRDPWVRIRLQETSYPRAAADGGILHGSPKALLTIKSAGTLVRSEFEYEIPHDEGKELFEMCKGRISKTRYRIPRIPKDGSGLWVIDEFHGALEGLWLAEIELSRPDEKFDLPDWVGVEVTEDPRYSNAYLVEHGIPV